MQAEAVQAPQPAGAEGLRVTRRAGGAAATKSTERYSGVGAISAGGDTAKIPSRTACIASDMNIAVRSRRL